MSPDSFLFNLFESVQVIPLTANPIIALVIATILLFFSSIVSASEIAFFALSPSDKNELEESETPCDQTILHLLNQLDYLLASILIWNNFINVAIVVLCTYAFNLMVDFSQATMLGFLLETVVLTFLLLLFSEIIPKIYAQNNALKFVRRMGLFMKNLVRITRPVAAILVKSTNKFSHSLKRKKDVSVDELSKALELTSGEIPEEKEMLEGIIKLYNKTAVEIMTPRLDVADVNIKVTFSHVIKYIIEVGYSRIPVYLENQDNIKGILYIKDLLPYIDKPESFRWQSLIRPAFFVPETKKIDDLLEEFRTNKIHLAVVVDEFGGTSGIVTMEDILEEIVGEINDEYDEEDEVKFIRMADGSYFFDAKIPLSEFFQATELDSKAFAKLTEDVDTLAGLILEIKGDFPKRNEVVSYERFCFKVVEINKKRILKVKFYFDQLIPKEQMVAE